MRVPWLLLVAGLWGIPAGAVAQGLSANEVAGGAAYNLALRLPMQLLPRRDRGVVPRLLVFTVGSLAYELFADPHHRMTNAIGAWTSTGQSRADVTGREVGYAVAEVIVLGTTQVFHWWRRR